MNPLLLFSLLTTFLGSCQGNTPSQSDGISVENPFAVTGDTVKVPGNPLMLVFQDKKNNYWFGSRGEGVYHYDGKTVIQYTTKHGLPHNTITQILEDKEGDIYFNTDKGISRFDGQTFTTLPISGNEWKLGADDLWFKGYQDSGVVYRYDGQTLHRLELPKTKLGDGFIAKYPRTQFPGMVFSPYDVYTIYKDKSGRIWFGTSTLGVCCYDGSVFTWISEDDLTELGDDAANGIRSIIEDKNGKFWFSNTLYQYTVHSEPNKGGLEYTREKGIGSLDGEKDGKLDFYLSATTDNNDELWIATYDAGVWRYDGKTIYHYPITENGKTVTLFSIYKDNRGALWLGTHENGVYHFNGKQFEPFIP